MKMLIFYICAFALISCTAGWQKVGHTLEIDDACLTENDASPNDMFTVQDILHDRHKQPENSEKVRKSGCVLQCGVQKVGMMDGAEFKDEEIFKEYAKRSQAQRGDPIFQAFEKCLNDAKALSDKCDKMFYMFECYAKVEDKMYALEH